MKYPQAASGPDLCVGGHFGSDSAWGQPGLHYLHDNKGGVGREKPSRYIISSFMFSTFYQLDFSATEFVLRSQQI